MSKWLRQECCKGWVITPRCHNSRNSGARPPNAQTQEPSESLGMKPGAPAASGLKCLNPHSAQDRFARSRKHAKTLLVRIDWARGNNFGPSHLCCAHQKMPTVTAIGRVRIASLVTVIFLSPRILVAPKASTRESCLWSRSLQLTMPPEGGLLKSVPSPR